MVLKVLKETAPVPPATQLELDTLSTLDPFLPFLVKHEYVTYIRNGETALMVRGLIGDDVGDVARILGFFAPLRVDMISDRAATHASLDRRSDRNDERHNR